MANALPKNIQAKVKRAVYKKADEFGYMECGRIESGRFLDILVDDPDVGKIIIEYMPKERVRTYIKDGILNAYTKAATKRALAGSTPANTIQTVFNETASVIQEGKGKQSGLFVLRSESGNIYVLGAAILMPQKEIDIAMRQFACGHVLKNYEGRFDYIDRLSLTLLCQSLGVSKSAAIIRLRQLGYIEDRPFAEYDDPLEVWL